MDLDLSSYFARARELYSSISQRARVVTEEWTGENLYCPRCGLPLSPYKNNTKVYDFYCDHSDQRFVVLSPSTLDNFQLKSMTSFPNNAFPKRILGSEYNTTVQSLVRGEFPSLILLHYDARDEEMRDGMLVHRLTITLNDIIVRKPLGEKARRKGWQGSMISIESIPDIGKISIIEKTMEKPKFSVMEKWASVERVLKGDIEQRGWTSDIMRVLDNLPDFFSLSDVYAFQSSLQERYPYNKHIKDKIRQQLQLLRDREYLKFEGHGRYRKL